MRLSHERFVIRKIGWVYLYDAIWIAAMKRAIALRNYAVEVPQKGILGRYRPRKCNELLNPTIESCLILSRRQPGKFIRGSRCPIC